jgi:hypothetical protein
MRIEVDPEPVQLGTSAEPIPQALLHEDGSVFTGEQVAQITTQLSLMTDDERRTFTKSNASKIAGSSATRMLVVSGPGTGKSWLFDDRITHWGTEHNGTILVTTFARKLAADLETHLLKGENGLSEDRNGRVKPYTLHSLARSILEQALPWNGFHKNAQILTDDWDKVVWHDANDASEHLGSWSDFSKDRCQCVSCSNSEQSRAADAYLQLCRYYNSTSFTLLVELATQVLDEQPSLAEYGYVIADELQDFNALEWRLVNAIIHHADGFMFAGDDDQVLYDKMKWSTKDLILNLYHDDTVAKAMLPFCGRCSAHIVNAGTLFMQHRRRIGDEHVEKVLLPLEGESPSKVQVVVCARVEAAQDFVRRYVQQRGDQLLQRQQELTNPKSKITDPFLLLLTPENDCNCLGNLGRGKEFVGQLLAPYRTTSDSPPEEYYVVQDCLDWLASPNDNWLCRKVLARIRPIGDPDVVTAIRQAVATHLTLAASSSPCVLEARRICEAIEATLESQDPPATKTVQIAQLLHIVNTPSLERMIESGVLAAISANDLTERAKETERDDPDRLQAADLLSMFKSKGLSADEVIILGFDQCWMEKVSDRAFYVAMTRARQHLTLLTVVAQGGVGLPEQAASLPDGDIEFLKYTKKRGLEMLAGRSGCQRYIDSVNYQMSHYGKGH